MRGGGEGGKERNGGEGSRGEEVRIRTLDGS